MHHKVLHKVLVKRIRLIILSWWVIISKKKVVRQLRSQAKMITNLTLLHISMKIKQILWMTHTFQKHQSQRTTTLIQLKHQEIKISIDHLLSLLHQLKWNLITQTMLLRQLYRNAEISSTTRELMKIRMRLLYHLTNSKMDLSTRDSGRMEWDMEEENNYGRMDRFMKATGRTTWLMEKADSSILMQMVSALLFLICY